jgi:uncharacterized repeat protein (TIGR01451 family)
MLTDMRDVYRSRPKLGVHVKPAHKVALALGIGIGASLLLLCACARQPPPGTTPTHASVPTSTPVPTATPPPLPTAFSPPGPPPAINLAIQGPGPLQVSSGEVTVYTLTVLNPGPAPVSGILLTDDFPSGLVPLWTRPARPICTRQGRTVDCETGALQAGDALTVTLDLSSGGTTTPTTGQPAGMAWDLAGPSCTIDDGTVPPRVTCRMAYLQPGAQAQMQVGVGVDAGASGDLVHTTSIEASEPDTDLSNNRAAFTMTVGPAPLPGTNTEEPALSNAEGPASSESVAGTPVLTTADLTIQAEGPTSVYAGLPFTYAYTITNRGPLNTARVRFVDVVPPATTLHAYSPGLPRCEQSGDTLTCTLRDPDSGETATFTVVIDGHAGQPMKMELDPLMPGWPLCTVLRERDYLHILNCELGLLRPGQATHVQLAFIAGGVRERVMTNTVSVIANEHGPGLPSVALTNTATITVGIRADLLVRSEISGPGVVGETLSYTLKAVNLGPSDADVILTHTLPIHTRLVSATSGRGDDCSVEREGSAADTLVCKLGRLVGGETVTVEIVVAVDDSLPPGEEIFCSARVISEQADPDPANNELTQAIPVSTGTQD